MSQCVRLTSTSLWSLNCLSQHSGYKFKKTWQKLPDVHLLLCPAPLRAEKAWLQHYPHPQPFLPLPKLQWQFGLPHLYITA